MWQGQIGQDTRDDYAVMMMIPQDSETNEMMDGAMMGLLDSTRCFCPAI